MHSNLRRALDWGRRSRSILDIDELLTHVVELIRDAFGYYQVLIFLVDETSKDLVLQAGLRFRGTDVQA